MNTYKEYLLEQLPNHLWTMKEKDSRDNRDPLLLKIKSRYIDDFFNYYLFEVNITPKELASAFKKDTRSLAEILYNPWFQEYEQRSIWIKLFEKEIAQNEDLFNSCLKQCLNMHSNLLENNPTEKKKLEIEENFESFKHLVDIGKEAGRFKHISNESLQTSYSLYKNHLEAQGLFNSDFSFGKLLTSLEVKNKNDEKNLYFQTYMKDIIDFLYLNSEKITEILKNDKVCKNFVTQILTVYDSANIQIQTEFIKNKLIENKEFRILVNINEKALFYKNFPQLIEKYFDILLPSETDILYSVELNNYYPSEFNSPFGTKITEWFSTILHKKDNEKKVVNLDVLDILIKKINSYGINGVKEYSGRAKINAINNNIKYTSEVDSKIINYIETNMESLFFQFYSIPKDKNLSKKVNYRDEDIIKLGNIYKFITEKYPSLSRSFTALANTYTKEIVAELFQSDSSQKSRFKMIMEVINQFKNPEILSEVINNNNKWSEVFSVEKIQNNKTKYIDLPLAFAVIEGSPSETFEWFLNSPQLEELADIKHKGKNIIEYLSETPKFNNILNILSENSVAFKALVLDNKKVFKKLSNHTDERIKKTTAFLNIEEKIAPKKEDSIKIKKI